MTSIGELQKWTESIILDPQYHAPLVLLKAVRNGAVYGTKIRFPHALVMVFLFRSGTIRQKLALVLKATRQHATNLATFALIYKSMCLALKLSSGPKRERSSDSFIAGLVGGYYVFGRSKSSVNQQICIYVAARVALALFTLAFRAKRSENVLTGSQYGAGKGGLGVLLPALSDDTRRAVKRAAWPTFAGLSWAGVMWLFRHHPDALQPSLRSSMTYIYDDAERWDSLRNFLIHNR